MGTFADQNLLTYAMKKVYSILKICTLAFMKNEWVNVWVNIHPPFIPPGFMTRTDGKVLIGWFFCNAAGGII